MASTSDTTKPPQITIYLAPLAEKPEEFISQATPTEFREYYETLENTSSALLKFTMDSPENAPNFQPPGGDLEKGMNYLMFYSKEECFVDISIEESIKGKASKKVPTTEAWKAAQVTFEYGSEFDSDDDSDSSEAQRGHKSVVADSCTGVYYLGKILEQDGGSLYGEDASETDNVSEDVEMFEMDGSQHGEGGGEKDVV